MLASAFVRSLTLVALVALAGPALAQTPVFHGKTSGAGCPLRSVGSPFDANGAGSVGGTVFVNLAVANPAGLDVKLIDVNTSKPAGQSLQLEVWTTPGGFANKTSAAGAWSLVSSGTGLSGGPEQISRVDATDFHLPPGLWGVMLHGVDFGHRYTTGLGSNQLFFSSDADLSGGAAADALFGPVVSPRVANVTFHYCAPAGVGTSYCRSTLTNRGCLPSTSSTGTASMTGGTGSFVVMCTNAPANRSGVLTFSTTGAQSVPFGAGTLCLSTAGPILKLGHQLAGGVGPCDGRYVDDFGLVIAANPFLFSPGGEVFCQYSIRDPGNFSGLAFSDGHRFAVAP